MHRVFPPALVAAIRDARPPLAAEVQELAAKMWCEGFPPRDIGNWHDLPHGSVERLRLLKAAKIALTGRVAPPLALAA